MKEYIASGGSATAPKKSSKSSSSTKKSPKPSVSPTKGGSGKGFISKEYISDSSDDDDDDKDKKKPTKKLKTSESKPSKKEKVSLILIEGLFSVKSVNSYSHLLISINYKKPSIIMAH